MVQSLCNHFSPPLLSLPDPCDPNQLHAYHPFPPPSVLSQPGVSAILRTLGFGYRAEFIQKTAKYLADSHESTILEGNPREASERWLLGLRDRSTADAREELLKLTGVGRKVADCVLLMSLDKVGVAFKALLRLSCSRFEHIQKEVVPVDTHVHQIAIKHYGMKGSTSGKTNMTPKLYDEVNSKLFSVWGDYAGWAHCVRYFYSVVFSAEEKKKLISNQVMFTADLKSFADYNMTPSSSPQKKLSTPKRKRGEELKKDADIMNVSPKPSPTPSKPTALPRATVAAALVEQPLMGAGVESTTLAERVKRRRMAVQS